MHQKSARRFLLINPNTNLLTTQRLQDTLAPQLAVDVRMDVRTASFGANYIACEASHAVAAHACLQAWADYRAEPPQPEAPVLEGVLIGCFGDPGLFALREVSACRVTGLAEASFITAAAHGPFSIVTGGARWRLMLERLAQSLGYANELRHIETVAPSGAALQANPDMAMACLSKACQNAMRPGVKAIILGGAGLAGYAQRLQPLVSLPVIDSAGAGLNVLLNGLAPPALVSSDGFFASWHNMGASFMNTSLKEDQRSSPLACSDQRC